MNINAINAFANFMKKPSSNPIQAKAQKLNFEIKDTVCFSGQKSAKKPAVYGGIYESLKELDTTREKTIVQLKEALKRGEDITEDREKLILSRIPVALKDAEDFVSEHPEFNMEDIGQDLARIVVEKTDAELKSKSKKSTFGTIYERSKDSYFKRILKHNIETIGLNDIEISVNPYEIVEEEAFRDAVGGMLETLTPREELIIKRIYGLGGQEPQTKVKIAGDLNVSPERIRHIEERSIKKLRHPSRYKLIKPFCNE